MYFPSIIVFLLGAVLDADANSILQEPQACNGGYCLPKHLCPIDDELITGQNGLVTVRIGEENECGDFMMICCKESNTKLVPTNVKVPEVDQKCGISNPEGLVYNVKSNLTYAKYAEFPWTVAIFQTNSSSDNVELTHVAGGTLIHPKFVLMAAHTLEDAQRYVARFGEWNMKSNAEIYPTQVFTNSYGIINFFSLFTAKDIEIEEHIVYPGYHDTVPYENDIALAVLKENVIYTEHIRPLCLPSAQDVFDGQRCIATGWGLDIRTEQPPFVMKRMEMNVLSQERCELLFKEVRFPFRPHRGFICAKAEDYQNTCREDGGAPLACQKDDGSYVLAGISSGVVYYRQPSIPGVYVDVASFANWINNVIDERD